jgi:hypothetical protein
LRHKLFTHFWKVRNNFTGIIQPPLIGFASNFNYAAAQAHGINWDFQIEPHVVIGYIGQVVFWIRCAWLQEPNGGFNGVYYFCNKVLLCDVKEEDWRCEKINRFNGSTTYNFLTTRLDVDPESEEYKQAYFTVWEMLTKASKKRIRMGRT